MMHGVWRKTWGVGVATLVLGCGPRAGEDQPRADTMAMATDTTVAVAAAIDTVDPASALRDYYAAINRRDYRAAYLLWGDSGRASGKSYDAFAAGFAGTDSSRVTIGALGRIEGAAGSRFVEVPVTVTAWTSDGATQHFTGAYVLRRVVVDGATPLQRRWHIDSGTLHRASP
jgi:hypothetical protein